MRGNFKPAKVQVKLLCNDQNGRHKSRLLRSHYNGALVPISKGFQPKTAEVYINRRLNDGRIEGGTDTNKNHKNSENH